MINLIENDFCKMLKLTEALPDRDFGESSYSQIHVQITFRTLFQVL